MRMRVSERQNEVRIELSRVAGRQDSVLAALTACRKSCSCTGGLGASNAALSVRARGDELQVRLRPVEGQQLDVSEIYRCLRRTLVEHARPLDSAPAA
ncbi:MAG TPA: hypothetical protein VFX81_03215 [Burkholderiaceae bacterium]|nr:hypothetical protein [Burkholderiaceae bacterium]